MVALLALMGLEVAEVDIQPFFDLMERHWSSLEAAAEAATTLLPRQVVVRLGIVRVAKEARNHLAVVVPTQAVICKAAMAVPWVEEVGEAITVEEGALVGVEAAEDPRTSRGPELRVAVRKRAH
jgi:hypothetical protein